MDDVRVKAILLKDDPETEAIIEEISERVYAKMYKSFRWDFDRIKKHIEQNEATSEVMGAFAAGLTRGMK